MLTKQSSQAAFKITKAGAKVGAKAGAKVAKVVVDISEKVTSSYGTLFKKVFALGFLYVDV